MYELNNQNHEKDQIKKCCKLLGLKSISRNYGYPFLIACDIDNIGTDQENVVIKLSAVYNNSNQRVANDIVINSFIVNIEEIELETDDDDEGPFLSDIELDGTFVVNLIEGNNGIEQTLAELNLPEGNYEEIEFSINENEDRNSEISGNSILISGTINDIPFEFWHNEDIDIEIEFENGMLTLEEGVASLINLQFDLNNLFSLIDLSDATDGNEDGFIQINPSDNDRNQDLADNIMDAIDDIIDAFEDEIEDDDNDQDDND